MPIFYKIKILPLSELMFLIQNLFSIETLDAKGKRCHFSENKATQRRRQLHCITQGYAWLPTYDGWTGSYILTPHFELKLRKGGRGQQKREHSEIIISFSGWRVARVYQDNTGRAHVLIVETACGKCRGFKKDFWNLLNVLRIRSNWNFPKIYYDAR